MKRTSSTRRGGFTLVEMLVVIAIIGILAAILTPTLYIAINRAKQTAIASELNNLAMHIEEYKSKYTDIPPDFSNRVLVARHLRKAFPRHGEVIDPATGLPAGGAAAPTYTYPDGTAATNLDPANLDPSEALVFWLGMIKNDPRNPLTGTSDPDLLFPFEEKRLVDLDGDGWLSYIQPGGKDTPYLYFDNRTYEDATNPNGGAAYVDPSGIAVYPYKSDRQVPNTNPAQYRWVNDTTFQIISAGLDGEFGDDPSPDRKLFPSTPDTTAVLNWSSGDLDNISNFSEGRKFEDFIE